MSKVLHAIEHTPSYVWVLLAYIVYVGIRSLKTRIVYLPKLFIFILILLATKYEIFLSENRIVFLLIILSGSIVSFLLCAQSEIKIMKKSHSIELDGSYTTLLTLLSFFFIKYYFGYLKFIDPLLVFTYSLVESIIDGVFSGYFIGRALCYTYKYVKAREKDA